MKQNQAKQFNNYNERSDAMITTSEAMQRLQRAKRSNRAKPIPEGGLLQSKYWADVLRAEGKNVWQVKKRAKPSSSSEAERSAEPGFSRAENVIYCTNYRLPLVGRYGYVPRAYSLGVDSVEETIEKVKSKSLGWLRLDIKSQKLVDDLKKKYILKKSPHNMQPKQNFIVDIDLSEEELLARMKSKTRYNIRLAKRKGVEILVTREQKYIDKFIDLVEQTAKRKGVDFHQREHYERMLKVIPEDILQLYVAKYEGEVIASNIISFYRGVATYLHGATSDKHRNVMAPFLLQWQAMLDAKEREIKYYDFGGIFPESNDSGQQGITRFKLGFSPKTKPFKTVGSYDVVLNKRRYWLYRFLQKIKK